MWLTRGALQGPSLCFGGDSGWSQHCLCHTLAVSHKLHRKHFNEISEWERRALEGEEQKEAQTFLQQRERAEINTFDLSTGDVRGSVGGTKVRHKPPLARARSSYPRQETYSFRVFFFSHEFGRIFYTKSLVLVCLTNCKYFSPAFIYLSTGFALLKCLIFIWSYLSIISFVLPKLSRFNILLYNVSNHRKSFIIKPWTVP